MMQKKVILSIVLLVWGVIFSKEKLPYQQRWLKINGQAQHVFLQDLNGDGHQDLLVIHHQSDFPHLKWNRMLSIFIHNGRTYLDHPTQTLHIKSKEILFDIADLDGNGTLEMLSLTREGVYQRSFARNGFQNELEFILKTPTAFLASDPKSILKYPFVVDLSNDSIPELLIPQADELWIFSRNTEGHYLLSKRLWTPSAFRISSKENMEWTINIPHFVLHDFNGDTTEDLLFTLHDRLDVFLLHKESAIPQIIPLIPNNLRYHLKGRVLNNSVLESLAPASVSLQLADLNADGFVDVLLSRASRASFTTSISQLHIFMNQYGRIKLIPDHILTAENFGGEYVIKDFNQDSLLDIAYLNFEIGFGQVARYLLTKKTGYAFSFYLMKPDHTYPKAPDYTLSFSRHSDVQTLIASGLCRYFHGDFNGDGFDDLLVGTHTNRVTVFPGNEEGRFNKKEKIKISLPVSSFLQVHDINNDGYSDCFFWYPKGVERGHQILLLESIGENP